MQNKKEYLKFIISMLIFGSNGLYVMNIALTSAQIVLTRTFFGSLVLLIVVLISRDKTLRSIKSDLVPVLISGVCLGVNWILLFEAYRYASVSIGTLVYYCGPIIVMALTPLIFKEKLTWNKLVAIAAVAGGMVCITGVAGAAGASMKGILFGGAAALLYATLIISNKFIKNLSGVASTLVQLVIGFVVVLIYLLFKGEFPFMVATVKELVLVLILGVVNSGLACYLYFSSMQKLPGQTVALSCYLDPLSTVLFSAAFLHEVLTPLQILGAALILGGALFGEMRLKKKKDPAEQSAE